MTKKKSKDIKKKAPARKRKAPNIGRHRQNQSGYQYLSYEITFEPIIDYSIPDEVQEAMQELYVEAQQLPEKAVKKLKELIAKYPKVPQLYNFLSAAYSHMGDIEKTKYYAEKNYQNNPDYLFAKLNYAEICMMEQKYERVPEILDHKFDLKLMYPHRDVFHITEVVNFLGIVGLYLAEIDNLEKAEIYYTALNEIVPDHPYTKRLHRQLLIKSVKKKFDRLIGR